MNVYILGLTMIALPIAMLGRDHIDRCAGIIILNWVAGYAFNWVFDSTTPWGWFLLIDLVAGCAMMWRSVGAMPVAIAFCYIIQIMMHFIYAYADGKWSQHGYWQELTNVAWLQLSLLGLWGGSRLALAYFSVRSSIGDIVNARNQSPWS